MDPNPLSFDSRLAFAREVEEELTHLDARTGRVMRGYLEQLVGPVLARMGHRLAHLPHQQHTAMMLGEAMMESARGMSESEINDRGLIGVASEAQDSPRAEALARDTAANKLAEMERSLRGQ